MGVAVYTQRTFGKGGRLAGYVRYDKNLTVYDKGRVNLAERGFWGSRLEPYIRQE